MTQDAGSLVPPGGTDGQVLGRSGGAAVWVDPSGGATPFWVTFTYADGECSADKTFAEIKAAHDAGDNCIGKVVEGPLTGYAPLSDITAIDATFCFASACMNINVTADGFVSTGRSYRLPLAGPGTLGGVSPETADDAMTQSVGVDDDGRLWTAPGPQGPKGDTGPQGPAGADGVGLPTVTAEDNGMYAGVVDGAWGKVSAPGGGGEWTELLRNDGIVLDSAGVGSVQLTLTHQLSTYKEMMCAVECPANTKQYQPSSITVDGIQVAFYPGVVPANTMKQYLFHVTLFGDGSFAEYLSTATTDILFGAFLGATTGGTRYGKIGVPTGQLRMDFNAADITGTVKVRILAR